MVWWNPFRISFRNPAEEYKKRSEEFLKDFQDLKQLLSELQEMVSTRVNVANIIDKCSQIYEIYRRLLQSSNVLESFDKRWGSIGANIEWSIRGITYFFKHEKNFDYDESLKTLNTMNKSIKKIEDSLIDLRFSI